MEGNISLPELNC